ncbi:MAG: 50S ribosomal protein L4 [Anaerolineae bacterium SM23_84]|nr:MAG: 50S ribosomal protein L4 [Anaerolineae bacterium SM23_84]
MRVSVRNMAGETVDEIELRDDIFGLEPHEAVMHQAVLRQLANARLGTAATKTRTDVSGGGRKPWRQKGTGRARQGSTRAPQWRKGGIVFGPHPRSYRQRMPRKMRRLALKSALSLKAAADSIVLLDELSIAEPKTKDMLAVLDNLQIDSSALILLSDRSVSVEKSAGNIPDVKTLHASCLNVIDILNYDTLVLPVQSLAVIEQILG